MVFAINIVFLAATATPNAAAAATTHRCCCELSPRACASRACRCVMTLMFVLQLGMGYLLMLVAMTYQLELFVAIIAGLGAGHAAFAPRRLAALGELVAQQEVCH